jgi:hypothetical protein
VKKRGQVPEVPAKGTSGTPKEVSGVVHGIYFLEKNEQVPRYKQVPRSETISTLLLVKVQVALAGMRPNRWSQHPRMFGIHSWW